jgi:beta-ribofuranosylaminobenzene 5'-phosphate synthase
MTQDAARSPDDGWVRVRAPSRLHFGLLALPDTAQPTHWPDVAGRLTIPRRNFGGAGLMIEEPRLDLVLRRAGEWSAQGPQADRVLAASAQARLPGPCEVVVLEALPAHAGLGSGTQLALALARAAHRAWGVQEPRLDQLAQQMNRGRRSAVGLHGFSHGGLVVEAGQSSAAAPGSLVVRRRFPEAWSIVVALPPTPPGLQGPDELTAFAELAHDDSMLSQTDAMCRLLLLGILPALEEHDLPAFGEALGDYNRRAGQMFRALQGGQYTQPLTAAMVDFLGQQGIAATGQSSWGPATFAIVERDRAEWVQKALVRHFGLEPAHVIRTSADNRGARC